MGKRDRSQGRLILGYRSDATQGQHAVGIGAGDAVLSREIERVAQNPRERDSTGMLIGPMTPMGLMTVPGKDAERLGDDGPETDRVDGISNRPATPEGDRRARQFAVVGVHRQPRIDRHGPPPSVKVPVTPDGVTTGGGTITLTVSAVGLPIRSLSTATIEIARRGDDRAGRGERDRRQGRLVLGRRGTAGQGQHPGREAAGDAVLVRETEQVGRLVALDEILIEAPVRTVLKDVTVTDRSRTPLPVRQP